MTTTPVSALRIKLLTDTAILPTRAHSGDAGVDLCADQDCTLAPGQRALVSTGIALELPEGYVGLLHPRSGLAYKVGLSMVNAPGTIDSGYRGEIKVCLINLDPHTDITVKPGDRIAQLLIQQVELWQVEQIHDLSSSQRGESGFGSSGGHSAL